MQPSDLTGPLRRHWPVAVSLGLAMAWYVAVTEITPLMVRLHGSAAAGFTVAFNAGQVLGLVVGGLLWTRWPAARPATAAILGAAALLLALLPWAPAGAAGAMHGALGIALGMWIPAWAAAFYWQVPPGERGRVVGWGHAISHLSIQAALLADPWLSPALLVAAPAALLAVAAAIALPQGRPAQAAAGPGALRPWRWLLLMLLLMAPVWGLIRAVDAPALAAGIVTRQAAMLFQVGAAFVAGLMVDRRGRIPAGVAGLLILGMAMGIRFVSGGPAAQVMTHMGVRAGFAMVEVFWVTVLADLAGVFGPAATSGFGHAIASLLTGPGLYAGQWLPPSLAAGLAAVAVFMATGVMRVMPETGRDHPRPSAPDLAPALRAAARRSLSERETEVALLLLKGRSTSEIAAALSLTENTVRAYLRRIFSKTGTANRQELMARVLARVMAPPEA